MSGSAEMTPNSGTGESVEEAKVGEVQLSQQPGTTIITAETDKRALIGTALWGWILWFVPVLIHLARINAQLVTVRGSTLTVKTGMLSKKYNNIELYRVKDITATDSAISSGRICIVNSDGSTHWVKNLKEPNEFAYYLRSIINQDRVQRGVVSRENL